ncbi:MAG: TetR/AcrR family transcriptional regulator [Pleurocapsa minor GSE-CHR-MK-17-07R]|jgi:AcrR family transcriptional regulator|nr:TetR/AcrR family transcriptional regulator [Pleurocapsa minor GSE-CHR-MK 17-07R]
MARPKAAGRDLREACIAEALKIIETDGVEQLSLREISRRLGVSHQAPYKHFASRDHILAEIVRQAFDAFAAELDGGPHTGDARADMSAMGEAYLRYARAHPLQYRLMFGTPLPNPAEHPDMMHSARHAFALLHDCIGALARQTGQSLADETRVLDALYVWATLHGMASMPQTSAVGTLGLPEGLLQALTGHGMQRMGSAMDAAYPPQE